MRHNTVVIKGNRAGMSVYLDPMVPFEKLLEDVAVKFRESAEFWGSVQMTLSLEGRPLSPEQEFKIVNTITENSQIEILCLLDTNADRIHRCEKALNEKLMELSERTGQFFKGDLHRGDTLESEASIVVIGDVEHGARVTAKGNIIVLGELRGSAFAGASGDENTVIVALDMVPLQIRIGDHIQRGGEKGRRLGKGPVLAYVDNHAICTKTLKKSMFGMLNFI